MQVASMHFKASASEKLEGHDVTERDEKARQFVYKGRANAF